MLVGRASRGARSGPPAAPAPPPPPPPRKVEGSGEFAFVNTTGNAQSTSIGLRGEIIYRPAPWLLKTRAGFVRLESDEALEAQSFVFLFRAERELTPRTVTVRPVRLPEGPVRWPRAQERRKRRHQLQTGGRAPTETRARRRPRRVERAAPGGRGRDGGRAARRPRLQVQGVGDDGDHRRHPLRAVARGWRRVATRQRLSRWWRRSARSSR